MPHQLHLPRQRQAIKVAKFMFLYLQLVVGHFLMLHHLHLLRQPQAFPGRRRLRLQLKCSRI